MTTKLAVIGAGAKAAAIAAKAQTLTFMSLADIEVTIFEKNATACNWHGDHGYTDGVQELCTPITRDIGFPYEHEKLEVVEHMMSTYSWPAHLVRTETHTEWVNQGRDRPSHHAFHDYLNEVLDLSGADVREDTEVVGLKAIKKQWLVSAKTGSARAKDHGPFDAVVVTGPGPANRAFGPFTDHRFFDCEDVWRRLPDLKAAIDACDERIVIVGGGGAAAAIAGWLIGEGYGDREIRFISRQATLYTRTSNYFENRVFQDQELWQQLSRTEQREFVDRLTRSVVWEAVAERLSAAQDIRIQPARATSVAPTVGEPTLTVLVTPVNAEKGDPPLEVEGSVVIDATGFDAWWFTSLLPDRFAKTKRERLRKHAEGIDYHLRFPWKQLPPLHVPTLAFAQGPGFNSLMALGQMADRILDAYRTDSYVAPPII